MHGGEWKMFFSLYLSCVWISSLPQVFSDWLVGHLLSCLFPGAGFARRTTALSALSLLMDMVYTKNKLPTCEYNKWQLS